MTRYCLTYSMPGFSGETAFDDASETLARYHDLVANGATSILIRDRLLRVVTLPVLRTEADKSSPPAKDAAE